ncbi:hypothetical protein LTR27_012797 [Elasticomyces elasticus]|nr:hypothetical protein LTR27_012797 [Elasticomyces elasticus]
MREPQKQPFWHGAWSRLKLRLKSLRKRSKLITNDRPPLPDLPDHHCSTYGEQAKKSIVRNRKYERQGHFRFFDLPAELRICIYREVCIAFAPSISTWYYHILVPELPRIWYAWEQGPYFPKPRYMEDTLPWRLRTGRHRPEGHPFPEVPWAPWRSEAESWPPKRNFSEIRSLLLIHPQLGNELLPVWAEHTTHELLLDITFWRSAERQKASHFDHQDWIGDLSTARLARAAFSTLREFLAALNTGFGLAQKVRHIKLTAFFEGCRHRCAAKQLTRLDAVKLVQELERLESPLVHDHLRVDLQVTYVQASEKWARRTFSLRQRHTLAVTRSDAEPPWVCTQDLIEVKEWLPYAGSWARECKWVIVEPVDGVYGG